MRDGSLPVDVFGLVVDDASAAGGAGTAAAAAVGALADVVGVKDAAGARDAAGDAGDADDAAGGAMVLVDLKEDSSLENCECLQCRKTN